MDPAIRMSYNIYKKSVENYIGKFTQNMGIKCLICFVILILLYIFICEPLLYQLRIEIERLQGMINLIPTKLLLENEELKNLLFKAKF